MRTLTDAERIVSIREALDAACGDWHAITPLLSIQADLNWLLERAASPPPPDLDRLRAATNPFVATEGPNGELVRIRLTDRERLARVVAALEEALAALAKTPGEPE